MLWTFVALRIVSNPLSNVFQKLLTRDQASPLFVVAATHGMLTIVCLPAFLSTALPDSPVFWLNMAISALLGVAGNVLLVQAVKLSDLSVLGPINAYKSVASLVPAAVLLHEVPGLTQIAGIVLIIAGSYFIVDKAKLTSGESVFGLFIRDRGIQYRLAALVLTAAEAVFVKRALIVSDTLNTFAVWSAFGLCVAMPAALLHGRRQVGHERSILAENKLTYLMLALTTGLMQFSTIAIFTGLQVAAALALFQTSTLMTVVLGWRVFGEENFVRRFAGSAIMVGGAVLIVLTR